MKRIIVSLTLLLALSVSSWSQDINGLATDFKALLTNITRSVAPAMQMQAVSGNIVADATIDGFKVLIPAVSATFTDGIAPIMEEGAYSWNYGLPGIVDSLLTDQFTKDLVHTLEYRAFALPNVKFGFGIALGGGFDVILYGMAVPKELTALIMDNVIQDEKIKALGISMGTINIGGNVRKTFMRDSGFAPAVSLGLLYNFGWFDLQMSGFKLSALTGSAVDLGGGLFLDMTGKVGFNTWSHNAGAELHVSKHFLVITPYAKLAGVFQYASTATTFDVAATIGNNTLGITTTPTVPVSSFSTLATVGIELFYFLNVSATFDLARFNLGISDFSLTGVDTNGMSVNIGLCFGF